MEIAVYTFIFWMFIIIFAIIPKNLNNKENLIIIFVLIFISKNLISIFDLNLNMVQHSRSVEKYIALLIQNDIIPPLSLITYVNLIGCCKNKIAKIIITFATFILLFFIEELTVWLGIKFYIEWNRYYTSINLLFLVIVSLLLAGLVKRLP